MDFINIIGTFFDNSIEHVVALAHQIKDLRLNKNQQEINEDLYDQIRITKETKDKCKGYYDNYYSLNLNVPHPLIGDWAIVRSSDNSKWYIYKCVVEGYWKGTNEEYTSTINLPEYAKRSDLKTINGQSVLGEGNIEINNSVVDSGHDGLMSSDSYVSLLTIQHETIPQIRENINHILALFGDEDVTESIQAVLDRYNQIAEFITSLGDNDNGQILYDILRDIADLKEFTATVESEYTELKAELTDVKDDNTLIHVILDQINDSIDTINQNIEDLGNDIAAQLIAINNRIDTTNNRITALDTDTQSTLQDLSISISNYINRTNTKLEEVTDLVNTETNRAKAVEQDLAERISRIEENPITPGPTPEPGHSGDSIKHLFMTQAEYDALESYEKDTIYFILEYTTRSASRFGDTFPFVLGGSSKFGDEFPLTLN